MSNEHLQSILDDLSQPLPITDEVRWQQFALHCAAPWDELSEEWKEFYYLMGNIGVSQESLNKSIDAAIEGYMK